MKTILGKLKLISMFIVFFNTIILNAGSIETSISNTVTKGELIEFKITANGKDIKFPNITSIDSNSILGKSNQSMTKIINSEMYQSKSIIYAFRTNNNTIKIPSFEIIIDGEVLKTKEYNIKVKKPTISKSGDPLVFKIETDKTDVFMGEPIHVKLTFKYNRRLNIVDLNMDDFKPEHFDIKLLSSSNPQTINDYRIITQDYLVIPQISGKLTIKSQKIIVSLSDDYNSFFSDIKRKKIYSNNIEINSKKIPDNLLLIGDYTINATVDKTNIDENKPLNLTLTIKGTGNINSIPDFDFSIPNTVIYKDKSKINYFKSKKKVGGVFEQKISIVGTSDYIIPKLKLKFFNNITNKVKTIQTEEIKILVKKTKHENINSDNQMILSNLPSNNLSSGLHFYDKKYIFNHSSFIENMIFLLLGIFLTILFIYIKNIIIKRKNLNNNEFFLKIKKSKSDKELYDLLLSNGKDDYIRFVISKLEENIYESMNNNIDKKNLIKYILNKQSFK